MKKLYLKRSKWILFKGRQEAAAGGSLDHYWLLPLPTFLVLLFSGLAINAQTLERQVIGSTGGTSNIDSGRVLNYNVGEAVIGTGVSGTFALTQGFEQADSLKKDTTIGIVKYEIFKDYNVYPNPGREMVFLQMLSSRNVDLKIMMYDENGKEIKKLDISLISNQSRTEEIATVDLSFGTYFFHFVDRNNFGSHVVKWVHY